MDPLSLILDLVLPMLPEPWRTYVRAVVVAVAYLVLLSSIVTAKLPAWAFKRWRGLRIFSWLSALAPRDAAGTIKLPGTAPHDPGAIADLAAFRAAASRVADQVAPLVPAEDPAAPRETQAPPPSGQSGRVTLASLLVLLVVSGALMRCPGPVTPVDGGPAVTPSSWTATARVVLSTLRWALPAARAITDVTVAEPGRTQVARALDAAAQAAQRMDGAVTAYETAGGDRCAARAAVAGLHVALVAVAQTLADNGIALGTTLERVVDGVASIADALVPACDADVGWSSAGDASNATLRAIAARAGRPLSRVLDDLRPVDGGVAP